MPKNRAVGPTITFLELEPSGWNALTSIILVLGLMDECGRAKVFTVGKPLDEKPIIARMLQMSADWDLLVTWGGESKMPFITSRALHNGLDPSRLHGVMQLDLKRYVREKMGLEVLSAEELATFLGLAGRRGSKRLDIMQRYQVLSGGRAASLLKRRCVEELGMVRRVFMRLRPMLRSTNPELAL
ncbi:MAG: ribonuclease H-like domain-containing protein [Nitrososphaerota archaeon]